MVRRFLSTLSALVLLSAILAPAQARATSIKDLSYLVGTWNCVSGHQKYTETWAYVVGGGYLRGTDNGPGMHSAAEHTITVAKDGSTINGVDLFPFGMDIMRGTGSSTQATLHAVFPPQINSHVVFHRTSAAKYTVDVSGSQGGKAFKEHNVCTKA